MFHYVKPYSNYYHFDLDEFDKTVQKLTTNKHIISLKELDNLVKKHQTIPEDAVMLTFDDGTIDHYQYVYPILKKYNCSGLFFIPSCTYNKKMLDIQVIHQLLENNPIETLFNDLRKQLEKKHMEPEEFSVEENLDSKKTALFKQLLQYKLPNDIRINLLHYFQRKYKINKDVSNSYMSIRNLKQMKKDGMYFGVHTITHPRLALQSKEEQAQEVKSNLESLLKSHLLDKECISLAFPYGSYNEDTIDVMKNLNIKYGFKVDDKESNNDEGGVVLIDRLDCNILREVLK